MGIVLTGSIAYDYLMSFPGRFSDHLLPDRLDRVSLSFLVDTLVRQRGGVAANIAYTLALLGERPTVMATVGEDYQEDRLWLESQGVDTSAIRAIPGLFTASFFVNTDQVNAQIASFYTGAMARASDLHFGDLPVKPGLAVISPNDPGAMRAYVHECRKLGIPYVYDPSQQIVRLEAGALREGIEGCRALFANDYEWALIEDKTGIDLASARQTAELVVITCGAGGADLYAGGESVHVPVVPPIDVSDPTGVGDAFRGGFLKGYLHNLSLEICGQMGALAATYCLESSGPQSHRFNLKTFVARFRENFDDQGELDRLQ
jgi:adenosine kinase